MCTKHDGPVLCKVVLIVFFFWVQSIAFFVVYGTYVLGVDWFPVLLCLDKRSLQ